MIRDGIPADQVEPYLHARAWLTDAARLLGSTTESLAAELIETMLRNRAIVLREGRLHASAEHSPVDVASLRVPFPRAWPERGAHHDRRREGNEPLSRVSQPWGSFTWGE